MEQLASELLFLDPFDTIKVRLQTSSANASGGPTSSSPAGGFKSLFKGMSPPLATAAICNAIIFGSYGFSTRLWEEKIEHKTEHSEIHGAMREGAVMIEHGEHGTHEQMKIRKQRTGSYNRNDTVEEIELRKNQENAISSSQSQSSSEDAQNYMKVFICGSIAGTVQAFVICPVEHIKCRLQVQSTTAEGTSASTKQLYKGPIDACTSIIKNHGIFRGLYRGMGVTLWRETPAFGLYFAAYDTIKDRVESFLEEKDDDHPIPSHAHAWAASSLAGGISGASTWAIIYPFDVIKSQMQTSPLERHLQKGMWTVGSDIVREHGWKRMFRGLGVTLVRAFPVNAIIFPVYEFVLMQIGSWSRQDR
jgi:solute carrier family 25 carnitine/acylcarnitine transporter 20/29